MTFNTGSQFSKPVSREQQRISFHAAARLTLLVTSSIAALGASSAIAGEAPSVVEEIIVTATKREERLQDVPLSISVLSSADLERQGHENSADFARQLPGVNLSQGSKNRASLFSIRGIATGMTGSVLQKPVAVYIDEVPVTNIGLVEPDLRLYDIERVEVLRGPQGTLFGSGSLSGAVRVLTKKADPSVFDSSVSADLGLTGQDSLRQRYSGMLNIPLVRDDLALRFVGYYRHEEGHVDDVKRRLENIDTVEDWGVRASLRWTPSDQLSVNLGLIHEDSNADDFALFNPVLGKHKASWFTPNVGVSELTIYNATVGYDLGWASLMSSTNYSRTKERSTLDISNAVGNAFDFGFELHNSGSAFVEEIRLVSAGSKAFDWVLGGFFMDRTEDGDSTQFTTAEFLQTKGITGLPGTLVSRTLSTIDITEIAAFGEIGYHITDTLTVRGGVRFARFETTNTVHSEGGFTSPRFFAAAFGAGGNVALGAVTPVSASTGKLSKTTKKLSVTWQPTETQTYYVQISDGFRIGQPNGILNGGVSLINPNDVVIPPLANSDTLWNYELGAKTVWLDGRLRANLAVYYIEWQDVQLAARRSSDAAPFVANAGEAVSKGVELEAEAWPTDSLVAGLNVTLQDAKYTKVTDQDARISGAVSGHELSSPSFQIAGYVQYTWRLASEQEMYARMDVQHIGGYPNGLPRNPGTGSPNLFLARIDPYENVSASVGWTGGAWSLSIYGDNLLSNDDYTFILDTGVIGNRFGTLRPRTVGIRASWKH